MCPPIAVVGDVHGNAAGLSHLVNWLKLEWTGQVVFVGDYVNRGPDSRGVLDQLVEAREFFGERLTLLMGNHDAALIDFLEGGPPLGFIQLGGLRTIRNYLGTDLLADPFDQFRRQFPIEHLEVIQSLELSFETEEVLVTHAGFNPSEPSSRLARDVVFGRFAALFEPGQPTPRSLVVCGHYVQRTLTAYQSDRFICIDSGSGTVPGAPLSLLLLPAREIRMFTGAA